MRFKVDWASLILGRKFTVFLCSTLYLRAISKYKSPLYMEGRFNRGFFALRVWEPIFGGAYFQNFMVFTVNIEHFLINCSMPL